MSEGTAYRMSVSVSGDPTILREAREFLEVFHREASVPNAEAAARQREVSDQILLTGRWEPATRELEFGARLAWRNNARCIGRLFWSSLQVRDLRHLDDPDEIYAALLDHLKLATNGGRIRPMATIFAPAAPGSQGWRIWNHQLCGYAAYVQADGSIVGDPKNLAFTEQVRALGWAGEGAAFDLLPIVIQPPGGAPILYPPPRAETLEVPLSHPEYAWFAELKLRWYAVPVLADRRLRLGGLDFTAAPFNGWYMGTEIGSRDLGDVARYNLLPLVARRMGLDCSSDATLWKDRALVEINRAVLHSYQIAGVRIVDHHRASAEFMEFAAREERAGREVSADWSWIVPPLSGSATPVFHRLWEVKPALPDYLVQPPPA